MRAFLFDANAVVEFYEKKNSHATKILDFVIEQRVVFREAVLYVPTVCIAEIFNVFAKLHYERKLPLAKYHEFLQKFRMHLHWAAIFYPYELNRYHILAVDDIIPAEYEVPRMGKKDRLPVQDRLSGVDLLLVAMGSELAYQYGENSVFILTGDSRVKRVCEHLKVQPPKDRESKRLFRELGQPRTRRWPAPMVFDIFNDSPSRLPVCLAQKALNLRND